MENLKKVILIEWSLLDCKALIKRRFIQFLAALVKLLAMLGRGLVLVLNSDCRETI